jgi:hypothetical protein
MGMMSAQAVPPPAPLPASEQRQIELDMLKADDEAFAALEAKFLAELEISKQ